MTNNLTKKSLITAVKYLAKKDKDLGTIFKSNGVPPLWARRPGFTTLIKIILEQQVSLASAKAVYTKVALSIKPFTPQRFEELGVRYLKTLGVTRQKSSYIINVANEIYHGNLDLKIFNKLDDEIIKEKLMRIKGIGSWSADIYLLMALRRPDVWPAGDIALEKTIRKIKRLRKNYSSEKLSEVAEKWRPYRSVAARMLWHNYLSNRNQNS